MDLNQPSTSELCDSTNSILKQTDTSSIRKNDGLDRVALQSTLRDTLIVPPSTDFSPSRIEESNINLSYRSTSSDSSDESFEDNDNETFAILKNKFENIDRKNEKEIISLVQELLELVFKPSPKYAIPAIEMALELPLKNYAKHLVKLYKNKPTNECFTKRFFEYLGCYNQYSAIQKSILSLMLELVKDYHNYGKKLTVIWFGSSPFRSMFLHIHETGFDEFLESFNKTVIYRQKNPEPDEIIIVNAPMKKKNMIIQKNK